MHSAGDRSAQKPNCTSNMAHKKNGKKYIVLAFLDLEAQKVFKHGRRVNWSNPVIHNVHIFIVKCQLINTIHNVLKVLGQLFPRQEYNLTLRYPQILVVVVGQDGSAGIASQLGNMQLTTLGLAESIFKTRRTQNLQTWPIQSMEGPERLQGLPIWFKDVPADKIKVRVMMNG
jgi:hypothetical protein